MHDELVEEFAIEELDMPWAAFRAKLVMNLVIILPNVLIREFIIIFSIILETLELWFLSFATFVSHAERRCQKECDNDTPK